MQKNFDISIFIKNLGEDLATVFNRSSEQGIHPDEIGKTKEKQITKSIEAMLPNGVGVGSGFVFDSYGHTSNQCDFVLYERDFIPIFINNDNAEYSYYPCEGVIAVGEIKSTLNSESMKDSLLKLEKIKMMKRHYEDKHDCRYYLSNVTIEGTDREVFDPENKSFDNIFTFIFCKDNVMSVDTQLSVLFDKYRNNMALGVDRVYSLNKQIISKIYLGNEGNSIFSEKKCNGYCSIRDENEPFNVLIDQLSFFVRKGRTQQFNLRNYYKLNEMHIDKIAK